MTDKRQKFRKAEDISDCPSKVICPTSEREMDELRGKVLETLNSHEKLASEIKTNRIFDIAILTVGLLSLAINLLLRSS